MSIYQSGFILLSIAIGWTFGSTPAGKWIVRVGYRTLFITGSFITMLSGFALYLFIQDLSYIGLFLILTVQGLSFGLLFAVGTIASQEFAEPNIKGVSTSLQMFLRNIGTSIGVTIMGLIINQAATINLGIKNVFLYALCLSFITVVLAFLFPLKTAAVSDTYQESFN